MLFYTKPKGKPKPVEKCFKACFSALCSFTEKEINWQQYDRQVSKLVLVHYALLRQLIAYLGIAGILSFKACFSALCSFTSLTLTNNKLTITCFKACFSALCSFTIYGAGHINKHRFQSLF